MFFSTFDTCLSITFFLFFLPLSLLFYLPDPNPLLSFSDHVRERHLYTEDKRRGLFLEICPDGVVKGTPIQTENSVLQLRSVRAGETVIQASSSFLYLCANKKGHLWGQRIYTEADCTFKELLLEDGYTLFLSVNHDIPVSLTSKRPPGKHLPPFSRFLPMQNVLHMESGEEKQSEFPMKNKEHLDLDSDDPFGMRLGESVISPAFNLNVPAAR
nr:fibroblast growth factor 21-like isoform X1 [Paramormyrops kingsleyae]